MVSPAMTATGDVEGRPEAPDWSRGCTLLFCTRGDTTDFHGPLQRLLDRRNKSLGPIGVAIPPSPFRWLALPIAHERQEDNHGQDKYGPKRELVAVS